MEASGSSKDSEDRESNIQNVEKQIASINLSADQQKLVQELIDMGFAKTSVVEIVQNAGDIPKDIIVEQLLITKTEPELDDADPMWEDIIVEYKMVIVINKSLDMSIGKTASQAAHAALGLYEILKQNESYTNDLTMWNDQGSRKVVVEAKNTAELNKLCSSGKLYNIPFFCVYDAGRTEVAPESFTALAFFGTDRINSVTGKLRLLK